MQADCAWSNHEMGR